MYIPKSILLYGIQYVDKDLKKQIDFDHVGKSIILNSSSNSAQINVLYNSLNKFVALVNIKNVVLNRTSSFFYRNRVTYRFYELSQQLIVCSLKISSHMFCTLIVNCVKLEAKFYFMINCSGNKILSKLHSIQPYREKVDVTYLVKVKVTKNDQTFPLEKIKSEVHNYKFIAFTAFYYFYNKLCI